MERVRKSLERKRAVWREQVHVARYEKEFKDSLRALARANKEQNGEACLK